MDSNGWNAIAYNWLCDEQGVLYEGRGAGVVSWLRPYNNKTESICYTGDGDAIVLPQALESIRWLISDIQEKLYDHKLWSEGSS